MPYTLQSLPERPTRFCVPEMFADASCPTETVKFDPIGAATSAIASVSKTLITVKNITIGTVVAVGFLVVWNVFVK